MSFKKELEHGVVAQGEQVNPGWHNTIFFTKQEPKTP